MIAVLAGLYLGQWLDRKLGTAPWLLIVGVFAGAGASFYSMYTKLMAAQASADAAQAARRAAKGKPWPEDPHATQPGAKPLPQPPFALIIGAVARIESVPGVPP